VRNVSLWRELLGVEKTVIERLMFDEDADLVVAHVRATSRARSRCGLCGRRSPGHDTGEGRRRWRALDLGTIRAVLEADAPRVKCREHGVVVAGVPWARHDAGHTYAFDETVAWLATQASKSTVTELMRIAWRTVGSTTTPVDWCGRAHLFFGLLPAGGMVGPVVVRDDGRGLSDGGVPAPGAHVPAPWSVCTPEAVQLDCG